MDIGETKEKEERTRSSKKPDALTSLKILACYGGLDSLSVVKSLTSMHLSKLFYFCLLNKKL